MVHPYRRRDDEIQYNVCPKIRIFESDKVDAILGSQLIGKGPFNHLPHSPQMGVDGVVICVVVFQGIAPFPRIRSCHALGVSMAETGSVCPRTAKNARYLLGASLKAGLRGCWCRFGELNPGPTDYESVALPLS